MSEDLSAQPWSINKDDYELQEVIGKCPGKMYTQFVYTFKLNMQLTLDIRTRCLLNICACVWK